MLSKDSKCKFLDESADGYVKTEACTVIMVQKASAAKRCYANMVNIGVNVDGYKEEGITFPSSQAQYILMKSTLEQANTDPNSVQYIEAHGTGTQAGDQCEMSAIVKAYCRNRPNDSPLLVGSVKTNLGHSEPASALSSLVKVVMAFEYNCLAASINYRKANRRIDGLMSGKIKPVTENIDFSDTIIAINSFGFGGANCHILLKPNSKTSNYEYETNTEIPKLIPIFGRNETSFEHYLNYIRQNPSKNTINLINLTDKIKNTKGFDYRGFVIQRNDVFGKECEPEKICEKLPLWFIFTGMR